MVYEDEHTMAFLDWRQSAPGHVLIIPRRHLQAMSVLRSEDGARLLRCAALISEAVARALAPDGMQLGGILSNLRDAGQTSEDDHFHLHLLPRRHGSTTARIYPFGDHVSTESVLEEIARQIRDHI